MNETVRAIAAQAAEMAQAHVRINTGVTVEFDWHISDEIPQSKPIAASFLQLCKLLEIEPVKLRSKKRKSEFVLCRQVIIGILKTHYPNVKFRELGSLIGQDYSSAIYHFTECNNRLKYNDTPFQAVYHETEKNFKNWLKQWG